MGRTKFFKNSFLSCDGSTQPLEHYQCSRRNSATPRNQPRIVCVFLALAFTKGKMCATMANSERRLTSKNRIGQ